MVQIVAATWNNPSSKITRRGLEHRLRLLETMVGQFDAYVRSQRQLDSGGLIKGIFTAPEYFFSNRYDGSVREKTGQRHGRGVRENHHRRVLEGLKAISIQYPRLLIVPGTISWLKPINVAEVEQALNYHKRGVGRFVTTAEMEAFAIKYAGVQSGTGVTVDVWRPGVVGLVPVTKADLLTWKTRNPLRYDAVMDWTLTWLHPFDLKGQEAAITKVRNGAAKFQMQNTAYMLLHGQVVYAYHKHGNFGELEHSDADVVFLPGINSGRVELEGVEFGIEICLDHNVGAARRLHRAKRAKPDVQIILSDYVDNAAANVIVKPGGYVVHASTHRPVDGVFKADANGVPQAAPSPPAWIGGTTSSPIRAWILDFDINDAFSLADTFMDWSRPTPPKPPPKPSPKPFRSTG